MPVHDWTRVDAGVVHAFQHNWITELSRALNRGLLSDAHYALPERAKAVAIRQVSNHQVVAMVDFGSPRNETIANGLTALVGKAREALVAGIHLLLVDLFPPSADCALPEDKPLTCVAYIGGPGAEAFVELVAVGDALPEMPLFLTPEVYVPVPLEATYQSAWEGMPGYWREVLTAPRP